jgi:hypothetical protein
MMKRVTAYIRGLAAFAGVPREDWNPVRTVRVSDRLWEAAKRAAADRDETVTDVIIRALERYVREHPAD